MLQSHAPFICKQCISIKHWTPVTEVTEASTFRNMTDPRSHNCFMGFSSFPKIKSESWQISFWGFHSWFLMIKYLVLPYFLIRAILLIFILRFFFTIFKNLHAWGKSFYELITARVGETTQLRALIFVIF